MHASAIVLVVFVLLFLLPALAGIGYLLFLLCKALRRYIGSAPVREEKAAVKKSLGDVLKEYRIRCHMTQEFVAERLGVSRQAVSKWESGASEPSTSNLLALAGLYGVEAEEILRQVQTGTV